MTTKATLYLDATVYKTFKLRALDTDQSVSSLVNDAMLAQLAEDAADIRSIRKRQAAHETPLSYDEALQELQKNGVI